MYSMVPSIISSLMASSQVLIPPPPSLLPKAFPLPPTVLTKKVITPLNKTKSELQEAIQSLESREIRPSDYNTLISLCIRNKDLNSAELLRSHLKRTNHDPDIFLTNQFINLYSKCGKTDTARDIFDSTQQQNKNTVTWNAMMSAYCSDNRFMDSLILFRNMIESSGLTPDRVTYLIALRAASGSRCFPHGEQVHSSLVKNGCHRVLQVGNALISMYSKFDRPEEAEVVGDTMAERDEITWNSLIASKAKHDRHHGRAMSLLLDMMRAGFDPNEFTFGSLLSSKDSRVVKELHSQTIKRGLARNVVIGSSLLDAYARCEKPRDALLVFDSMPERNIVTWNSAIAACFGNDMVDRGMELFLRMGELGFVADEYTISTLLKVASVRLSTGTGKQLHGLAVKTGRQTDTSTCNGLISMYAKSEVSVSWKIFSSISEPDLVSWNSMARAFLANDEFEKSITVFIDMKRHGFRPDEYSFASALTACASLARYRTGKEIHGDLLKTGIAAESTFVGAVLIDMYSKCKEMTEARKVFDGIEKKDLITWNSIVSGFSQTGNLDQVLNLLCLMKEQENLEPDNFTFASVLSACAKTTAMPQGRQVHAMILKSEKLDIDAAVTNALITMYSRAGCIKEAETAFDSFDETADKKNVVSWTSMISGYAYGGYSVEAFETFDEMERSGTVPNGKTFVALLTACSYGGMSENGYRYFEVMKGKYGIEPGFDHYACMVDILSRAGKLEEAEDLIKGMPFEPDAMVWKMLLSGCRTHGDGKRGKRAMEKILALEPNDSAAYVLLSNLYADLRDWNGVLEVRQLMRENGVRKEVAKSWIQVRDRVHEFMAGGDLSLPRRDEIYSNVEYLLKHMKDERHAQLEGPTAWTVNT